MQSSLLFLKKYSNDPVMENVLKEPTSTPHMEHPLISISSLLSFSMCFPKVEVVQKWRHIKIMKVIIVLLINTEYTQVGSGVERIFNYECCRNTKNHVEIN